jgi:NAD(P)-dependent dehydrogenase (short-subunit alcohol dehydrogenase family)
MRFQNRTAIVTGGSLGIGRAVAERFASEGARVLITGRNAERLQQAARDIDGDVVALPGDIADIDAPQAIVDCAMAHWGRIDVLVNNAGIYEDSEFLELSRGEWQNVLDVVLTGPCFLAQACAREMVPRATGAIVNIASIDAYGSNGSTVAYGTAKAGLLNLTRYLATTLAPHGIRANSVSPGLVDTQMISDWPDLYAVVSREFKRAPLKRLIRTDEIASVVAFLASDEASAITGADQLVDAGLVADLYVAPTME